MQDAYLGGLRDVMSLLEVEAINSFYGDSHILFDVSLHVEQNEVVALLGRNGAGKTTTLRSIMGVIAPGSGSIRLDGKPIHGRPPYEIARHGHAACAGGAGDLRRADGGGEPAAGRADRAEGLAAGRGSTRRFRAWRSGAGPAGARCRAASSRCWRSRAR